MTKVLILNKFEYQTFPETSGMIKVKESDLNAIIQRQKCFDVENKCVIDYTPEENEGE